jgi:hypothetical protein
VAVIGILSAGLDARAESVGGDKFGAVLALTSITTPGAVMYEGYKLNREVQKLNYMMYSAAYVGAPWGVQGNVINDMRRQILTTLSSFSH